jgi:hypothetical protein
VPFVVLLIAQHVALPGSMSSAEAVLLPIPFSALHKHSLTPLFVQVLRLSHFLFRAVRALQVCEIYVHTRVSGICIAVVAIVASTTAPDRTFQPVIVFFFFF